MALAIVSAASCALLDPAPPPVAPPQPIPPAWVLDLWSHVKGLTGPDAIECGSHLLPARPYVNGTVDEKTLLTSVSCGLEAAGTRTPFWTFKQNLSEDSNYAQGLAGAPDGAIYRFSYDSLAGGRFTFEPCAKPMAGTVNGVSEFRCVR